MNPLRHLLLVAVLLFAQLAAGAHAVGHAANDEGGVPKHACELCLAAHDLSTALPSLAVLPPVVPPQLVPTPAPISGRASLPAPRAAQRGPPIF